jgi:erythromycin esterase
MPSAREKLKCCVFLLALPGAAHGQALPKQAFGEWAHHHIYPIASVSGSPDGADLQPLRKMIGDAHVIAFSEPIHDDHEPLAIRNRLIRYGVAHLGFTAVALETCLSSSKLFYDYVLGRMDATDDALKETFCYGFGDYPENLELLHWMRTYNAGQPPERKIHIYGIDLSGQYFPTAYHSLEPVFNFLDRADPALGRETRTRDADLIPIFRVDKYPKLSSAEKHACTGKIQDLISVLRRERTPLTRATSSDDYEWALRQAINAAQDDAFLRSLPPEFDLNVPGWWQAYKPDKVWDNNAEMREVAMADNVLWVQERECRRGKVFFFAHIEHIQDGPGILGLPGHPPVGQYQQIPCAGSFLRSALGSDVFLIGSYFGHAEGFGKPDAPPYVAHDVEDLLGSLPIPMFIMSLHDLPANGSLHDWFGTAHGTRSSILREHYDTVTPLTAYDAIFYVDTITPSPPPKKE